jgi:uncharacterized protein YgiM (DUF1202 family)
VKSPLRVGAVAAPKTKLQVKANRAETGKARRIANLSAAAAIVLGVGAASALFVDYLADRALARGADAPVTVKPVVAKALETPAETKVAALTPAAATSEPVEPPKAEIEAEAPDPAAVAKVAAVGPEHAIELPAEDPTASPILKLDEVAEDVPSVDASVQNEEPVAADTAEEENPADGTETAAIAPYAAEEPAIAEQPVKKPKRQKAEQAKPQAVEKQTEVASLPGVDVGGLAGNPSGDDNAGSTVRTVTKQTKNLGGVAAGAARVTAAVKLRSGPTKGSGVLGVVPAGSSVNVLSCDGWCQVSYNGRTGWVYKNFLAGSNSQKKATASKPQQKQPAAKSASAATQPTATPAPRKTISSRL